MNDDNPWLVLLANLAGIALVLAQTEHAPPVRLMWFKLHRGAYKVSHWVGRLGLWSEAQYWKSL